MRLALVPGSRIAGKYRIEKKLGEGGMGAVFAARDETLGRAVAIKLLHPDAVEDPETLIRFEREAKAAASLESEHVVRLYEFDQVEDGTPYMVMELLDGVDLRTLIEKGPPLSIAEAVDYVVQACEGLAVAHSRGIVHRDLKPSNLFRTLRPSGYVIKIVDFGVSKSMLEAFALTQTARMLGTPFYMAPEQMRSARDVDARSDIWSLGAILHELLCGKRPFAATTLTELIVKVATDELEEPENVVLPDELWKALRRAMAKSREHRFADVGQLALAIAKFGVGGTEARAELISRQLAQAAGQI